MSRSYKRHPAISGIIYNGSKRKANKKVRCLLKDRDIELPHGLYKRAYCSWDIRDYREVAPSLATFHRDQVYRWIYRKGKHPPTRTETKSLSFPQSLLRFDFALIDENNNILRLIEFDGEQHYEQNVKNSGWNTYQKYQYTLEHDLQKNQLALSHHTPLVRIPYWERDNITLEMLFDKKYEI